MRRVNLILEQKEINPHDSMRSVRTVCVASVIASALCVCV